ncbi:MAG TPA: LCP family protein [Spirochaetia bacterium]|nr:LCP family protein [Spirochaetia bacterium]
MKRAKFDSGAVLLGLIVLVAAGVSVFLYMQVRTDKVTSVLDEKKEVRVLFVVADGDKPIFTNAFLYNPTTRRAALFDIPGNVGSLITSLNRVDRIDVLYKKGRVDEYKKKIESLLNVTIPFYWVMSPRELGQITDLAGGLSMFLPNAVNDTAGASITLLPAGNVVLDGAKVQTYLSYGESQNQNIDRFEHERKIMQAFLRQLGQNASFLTNVRVLPYLMSRINTNMDSRSVSAFIREISHMDERVVSQRVLGDLKSVEGTAGTEKLLFPYFEGQLLKDAVRQVQSSLSNQDVAFTDVSSMTVQILNGTATPGLAARTKELYQSYGFQNVLVGNADSTNIAKTEIIDHKGNQPAAQRVAEIIRAKNIVREPPDPQNTNVDVTVILGNDFDGWYVK